MGLEHGIVNIKLSQLSMNTGQIPDVPANPRIIKDTKFDKLLQSIIDDPEMLTMREMLVYEYENKFIVLCGNMRLKALKELQIPSDRVAVFQGIEGVTLNKDNTKIGSLNIKLIDSEFAAKKLRAISMKDNNSFGEWDFELLANEWDLLELDDWGFDGLLDSDGDETEIKKKDHVAKIVFKYLADMNAATEPLKNLIKSYENVSIEFKS